VSTQISTQIPPERERVVVRGFLVVSSLPSKSLLDTHLPEIFRDVRVGHKEIKLVTGYFYNKLGSLSRKFYDEILAEHAVDAGFGYIVPFDKAPEFLAEIDKLKKEYEVYEKQLKDFLLYGRVPEELKRRRAKFDMEYVRLVKEYLATVKQGFTEDEWRRRVESINIADRVKINLIPFSLDYSIIEEYIDKEAKARIEREIESIKSDIAQSVKRTIAEKARELINRAIKLAETQLRRESLDRIRAEVAELERRAREFGVEIKELGDLMEMLREEKLREIAVEATSGRLKALLEF
jgi:hypothetical protein